MPYEIALILAAAVAHIVGNEQTVFYVLTLPLPDPAMRESPCSENANAFSARSASSVLPVARPTLTSSLNYSWVGKGGGEEIPEILCGMAGGEVQAHAGRLFAHARANLEQA